MEADSKDSTPKSVSSWVATLCLVVVGLIGYALWSVVDKSSSDAPETAKEILDHQLQFWTSVQSVGHDRPYTDATCILTYLSPQLIEAAIQYEAETKQLDPEDITTLRDEVLIRLRDENRLPFILTVKSDIESDSVGMRLGINQQTFLYNLNGDRVSPSEYDRILEDEFIKYESRSGYLFFPHSTQGHQVIDLDHDASISVRLESIQFWQYDKVKPAYDVPAWTFNLVPLDYPLHTLARLELPSEKELSASDLITLTDMAITVVALLLK